MATSRSLTCSKMFTSLVLLLVMVIPSLFVHGSRLTAEERQPRRTAEDDDNIAVPGCSYKTNYYTVGSSGKLPSSSSSSSSSSSARSGVDDSDRLVPTGPNPLHHRHH